MALDNPFHKNLPIGKILVTGTLILILAFIAIAAVVFLQYKETRVSIQNNLAIANTRSLIAKVEHEVMNLSRVGGDEQSYDRLKRDRDAFSDTLSDLRGHLERPSLLNLMSGDSVKEMDAKLGAVERDWKDVNNVISQLLDNTVIWQQLALIRGDASARASETWVSSQIAVLDIQERINAPMEDLLDSTFELSEVYATTTVNPFIIILLALLVLIILTTLAVMVGSVLKDVHGREQSAEFEARRNQEAILKLLEETTKMADGDITVRATVDEAITGAIADALNFTLEEMSALIRRISRTADQVTRETEGVQVISEDLFKASQQQSLEIEQTANTVLQVTQSISEVAESASQSANVAQKSLEAANKGAAAVRDQINSMSEIRTQIQETAKRIKRLGDSSLEIGEIVSMISDITDQTNVLALNAAIQAASAGEAGRGFAVVAEEVQRLAERSAEATKQIAAIVKTIQSDTQDAVSAMERSTSGVVEGTRLSEEAGEALEEIERVSNQLAELIRHISSQTHAQSMSVDEVRTDISKILKVTEAATLGTEQTTTSINRLTQAAAELRAAISGFKV
jgi:methyl-accepting chemotaxis protein